LDAIDAYEQVTLPELPANYNDLIGDGDYRAIGLEFLELAVRFGKLEPDESVLDFGCGLGRFAQPALGYLSEQGRYTGMDVSKECIDWCVREIASDTRVRFQHIDIYHPLYNATGSIPPTMLSEVLNGRSFDKIFALSVFTHFSTSMVRSAIKLLRDGLKPGGRALITGFFLNSENKEQIGEWSRYPFNVHYTGPVFRLGGDVRLAATAIDFGWFSDALLASGSLKVRIFRIGHWWMQEPAPKTPFQDVVVIQKRSTANA
jgi:SAM-dependent methyltransferase